MFLDYEKGRTPEGQTVMSFDKLQPILQVIICEGGVWKKHKISYEDIDGYKKQFMTHNKTILDIYNTLLKEIRREKLV